MKTRSITTQMLASLAFVVGLLVFSAGFFSQSAMAEVVDFNFENSIDADGGTWSGEFRFEDEPTGNTPTYVNAGSSNAIDLDPREAVRYPGELTSWLVQNRAFTISTRFKVGPFDGEGGDAGYLWSFQKSRSWCAEGFTVTWFRDGDSRARLILRYGDDCDAPFWDENIEFLNVAVDEWVDMELVVDFDAATIQILANGVFMKRPFNGQALIENIYNGSLGNPFYLGWYPGTFWPHNPHKSGVVIDYVSLSNAVPEAEGEVYRDALVALTNHINGSTPLSLEEREAYTLDISLNSAGQYLDYREETDAFMNAFEEANLPLFHFRGDQNVDHWPPEDRAMLVVQQEIHDNVFIQGALDDLAGMKFETANVFPGRVAEDAPRLRNEMVEIDATYFADPAVSYPEDEAGALRPTGFYVPPGELVKVKIDASLRNLGLKALVGAHRADLARKLPIQTRFPRITKTYELDKNTTTIANPFGGALYIRVPPGTEAGWVTITIDKAVKAPYFRYLPGRETDPAEFQADVASGHVPWADFESEHMMFTWPSNIASKVQDPSNAMAQWDLFWEGMALALGRDFSAKKTEYVAMDTQLPYGGFSAGYPVPWPDPTAPYGDASQVSHRFQQSPLNIESPFWYRDSALAEIMLHEMGHNMRWPTLGPEVEAIAQMPFVAGFAAGLGVDIDESLKFSADPDQDRDHSAMDWIMTHNFRDNEEMGCDPTIPGAPCHELRYQHRGYAKYVDFAMLFGWDKLGATNRVIYDRWLGEGGIDFSYDKEFVEDDEYLRAAADSLGVNPMPLFHFWGVRGTPELEAELAKLPKSPEIYNRLMYYRSITPKTKNGFQPWYDWNRPRVDPVHFDRYDWALANWDSEDLGKKAIDQIDHVIDKWFGKDFDPDAAPFVLNAGLNDAWFNAATPGQGAFITVYPGLNSVFLALFTYDTQDNGASATFGEGDQRWLTAFGSFSGNTATLDVELTEGGVMDSASPAVSQKSGYGTITITFTDCENGVLTYSFPSLGLSGTIPLSRVAPDNVALCNALSNQAGD